MPGYTDMIGGKSSMNEKEIQLGISASQEGRDEDAIKILTRSLECRKPTNIILYHLARSLFNVKRFSESLGYWEEMLKLNNEIVEMRIKIEMNIAFASYMAALAESQQGNYRQAVKFMNRYYSHYPGDSKARNIIQQLEELAEDVETLQNHLKAASEHIEAGFWLEASDELLSIYNNKPGN
jgi:cytochrome c-type biogenesis protein CcmH/NrfG